jgi:hypothetical protein
MSELKLWYEQGKKDAIADGAMKLAGLELKKMLVEGDLTLGDVIDAFIDVNALIGVGLISLADEVAVYIRNNQSGYYKPEKGE